MTGNIAIDSVINYKLSQTKKMQVKVNADISIPEGLQVDEDDMAIILGNALDNTIEAVERLETGKFIDINVKFERNILSIYIKNSYDSEIHIEGEMIKTRKKEKNMHGIGLQSIKEVAQKYNGEVCIEHNKYEFFLGVILYL